jgi:hypothetical protein
LSEAKGMPHSGVQATICSCGGGKIPIILSH